jgi:hypothetical protein
MNWENSEKHCKIETFYRLTLIQVAIKKNAQPCCYRACMTAQIVQWQAGFVDWFACTTYVCLTHRTVAPGREIWRHFACQLGEHKGKYRKPEKNGILRSSEYNNGTCFRLTTFHFQVFRTSRPSALISALTVLCDNLCNAWTQTVDSLRLLRSGICHFFIRNISTSKFFKPACKETRLNPAGHCENIHVSIWNTKFDPFYRPVWSI